MDDMNAFERQVAGRIQHHAGPVRPVNDAAIFTAITTTPSPKWRIQSMFSATKFVVAGAIVALFGGFLVVGVLTQPSEESAPAAGTSTTPEATVLRSVGTSTDDLLAGMVTETIGPGIYEVMNDGAGHDFREYELRRMTFDAVHAGPDGAVYVVAKDQADESTKPEIVDNAETPDFWQVGAPGTYGRDDGGYAVAEHLGFTPDGTVWSWSNYDLGSFDGDAWTDRGREPRRYGETGYMSGSYQAFHVQPDGTVWLQALDTPHAVSRIDASGWTDYGEADGIDGPAWQIEGTADGDVWVATYADGPSIYRFTGDTWERHVPVAGSSAEYYELRSGGDGSLWARTEDGYLARYDTDGWTSWSTADLVPDDEKVSAWVVGRDGTVWLVRGGSGLLAFDGRSWMEHPVPDRIDLLKGAPDGTIWASAGRDMAAFDGRRWSRIALPQIVQGFDISPDGTVWAISGTQHLYVITPEAVAATE
jgi:hypothetical protein